MSTVEEITQAIERLPPDQLVHLRSWLLEYSERLWDEEIERDEREGRLDHFIKQAPGEHRSGRTHAL
jgi:hypothetical protein